MIGHARTGRGAAPEGKGGKKRGEWGKEEANGGIGGRKGRDEGNEKGERAGELVSASPSHDLFAPRPCQYSGRREAFFDLSNATICPHGLKLWCSNLAIDNALRG